MTQICNVRRGYGVSIMKKKILLSTILLIGMFGGAADEDAVFEVVPSEEESMTTEVSLEDMTAGAAELTEVGIEPSEEEVQRIVDEAAEAARAAEEEGARAAEEQANAWKKPGALVMADVDNAVNVRAEADENAEKVGKLYKDCGGSLLEYSEGWTKISSGDVTGWVNNDYLVFGDEAQVMAEEVGSLKATVNADVLNVRREASTESGVLGQVEQGDTLEVVSEEEGWIVVDFEGDNGYINAEYVTTAFSIDHGETMEAIKAREAAEKKAKEEKARKAQQAKMEKKYGKYGAEANDLYLLGAIIQCEAGNQSYEGKVAVGAVVMNRVRSGAYPGNVHDVIYASGQFGPAGSGLLARRLAAGVSDTCIAAAQEAINGRSNVGSATHFKRVGAHPGYVIGGHVFW